MLPNDRLLSLKFNVKGIEVEAEFVPLTPETVQLRIDPKTPWDAEALRCLGSFMEMLATTLRSTRPAGCGDVLGL